MIYFIVNETSKTGRGKSVWQQIEDKMKDSDVAYTVYKTEYAGHAMELSREICEKEDEDICLVSVGGDGTMNEIINGMTNFDRVRIGIIPSGSGNDFRRGLKLPKEPEKNLEKILELVKQGENSYTNIDLGCVFYRDEEGEKKRLYGISAGVGMDAIVCKKAFHSKLKKFLNKIHLGKLTYVLLTIQTLFSMKTTNVTMRFITDSYEKVIRNNKMIFAAAMNLRAEGGGVPMAPNGNPFDGLLSTCYAHGIPKWMAFLCFPVLIAGKHTALHGFDVKNSREVHMKLEEPFELHADGEYLGDVSEVTFKSLPHKLHMLM